MSTEPPTPDEPGDLPPPTEAQRAVRAAVLGAALGIVLAFLARRGRPSRA